MKGLMAYLVLLLAAFANTLDEDLAKERRCINTKTDPNISFEWLQSIEKWYFPTWSKLDFYRSASDLLEKPISENPLSGAELYESACVTCNANFDCVGFNHPPVAYESFFDETGVMTFKGKTKYASGGTHTIVLSDNKNYVLGISCWDDGESSYAVWTPTPTLSTTDRETIVDHLQKLGYNMEFMVDTPYDKCASENLKPKTEL